jgi:hypothetical protein
VLDNCALNLGGQGNVFRARLALKERLHFLVRDLKPLLVAVLARDVLMVDLRMEAS